MTIGGDDDLEPKLVTRLRRSIDELVAGRDDVVISHRMESRRTFGRDGVQPTTETRGWITTMAPVWYGSPLYIWFDAGDEDLALMLHGKYWFEWLNDADETVVIADVVGICAGVLAGTLWEWRTRRRVGCEVVTPDGRAFSVTDGRVRGLPWQNDTKVVSRHKFARYGRDAG